MTYFSSVSQKNLLCLNLQCVKDGEQPSQPGSITVDSKQSKNPCEPKYWEEDNCGPEQGPEWTRVESSDELVYHIYTYLGGFSLT